jgi:hypothetical protein
MSKKLEVKQRRRAEAEAREAERKRAARKRNLVTGGIALAIVAAVAAAIAFQGSDEVSDIGGSAADAGCDQIETFDEAGDEGQRDHLEDGSPVEYETNPPTYGPHYGTTATTSFYEEPTPPGGYVHNLEHGQIVIHYSPEIADDTKDALKDLVDQQEVATLAVPTEGLEKPIVFTAWGAMQACDGLAQEVADDFRGQFQGRGPENVGIPTFTASE